jgi:hypothetical protein
MLDNELSETMKLQEFAAFPSSGCHYSERFMQLFLFLRFIAIIRK